MQLVQLEAELLHKPSTHLPASHPPTQTHTPTHLNCHAQAAPQPWHHHSRLRQHNIGGGRRCKLPSAVQLRLQGSRVGEAGKAENCGGLLQ